MKLLVSLVVATSHLCGQVPARLTLREAEEIAVKSHPAVSVGRYTALAAAQAPVQIGAARMPVVSGAFTGAGAPDNSRLAAGAINNPIIYSRLATGVSINQLLFDFGRTSRLLESSKLRAESEEQNIEAIRNQILLEVDRAYFSALRAGAVLRVAQETVAARQLVVDQVTELQKARLKSGLDRSFAEVNLAEAKLLVSAAENERRAALANLAAAMNTNLDASVELVEEQFKVEPLALSELLQHAMRDRPDLKVRLLEAQASGKFVEAEKALRYPSITAMASTGWLPEHHSALRSGYGAAGINVSLPFLNGGLFKSRQVEAQMREAAAKERIKELENRIIRDVTVALLAVNNASERVDLTARLVEQAEMALDLAQSRYDLGLSSMIELSQAQLARTSAVIQNVSARYDYQLQRTVLQYHIGR